MDDSEPLRLQSERVIASGLLGQSRLVRLFKFLVECSAAGKAPKEAAIAIDVFGRTAAFDVTQDATVRVYIHNLRRKLDQYYHGPGRDQPVRLAIPRGEYRLTVLPWGNTEAAAPTTKSTFRRRREIWIRAGLACGLALIAVLAAMVWSQRQNHSGDWQQIRSSPVWARLLQNDRPIIVVLGDYYIFGDTEHTLGVKRLLREFAINSRDDLQQFLIANPNLAERYQDVELAYLPTSSAFALASVMPVLATSEKRRVRVMMMSALDPATIKYANIVYIGLLSGLGSLQNAAFAGSRFAIGNSFNEIIDRKTQRHYMSEATRYEGFPKRAGGEPSYRDYGFFSTFVGLAGNRIVIIAGTQDEGVRQTAELMTDPARLDELRRAVPGKPDVEALFEVSGMDRVNLSGKLLAAAAPNIAEIWKAR
jgi:hypothetical protein